jgi:casein kinase II subunit alpha
MSIERSAHQKIRITGTTRIQLLIFRFLKSNCEQYEIKRTLGRGKYSDVFEGIDVVSNKLVVIKILKPVRKIKISREIRILQVLQGGPHIVELIDKCLDPATGTPSLIFEYVSPTNLKQIMQSLSSDEIKSYMYQVLQALDFCHSRGIMHRDIKPMNIIVNRDQRCVKVIDWGLSEFYHLDKELNTRVSSRPYKSPELLLGYPMYDFSMDIWSLGCMFAAIIFKKEHFFLGKDNNDQLVKIVSVLGSQDFFALIQKYDIKLDTNDYPLYKKLLQKQI